MSTNEGEVEMINRRTGLGRRPRIAVALVGAAMLLLVHGTAQADVTAVNGSVYGYSCSVTVFGTFACTPPGPAPIVTLATDASNSPQAASAATGQAAAGPATIFSWNAITVSTQGTLGPTGKVTSTANIANVNASGNESFTERMLWPRPRPATLGAPISMYLLRVHCYVAMRHERAWTREGVTGDGHAQIQGPR